MSNDCTCRECKSIERNYRIARGCDIAAAVIMVINVIIAFRLLSEFISLVTGA